MIDLSQSVSEIDTEISRHTKLKTNTSIEK